MVHQIVFTITRTIFEPNFNPDFRVLLNFYPNSTYNLTIIIITNPCNEEIYIMLASICSGEHVILTCFSNTSSFLAWNITFPDETNQRSELRHISSTGHSTCQAPRTVFHTVFQFVRTSIAPLISTLAVYNMTSSLNGTRVTCLDAEDNYSTISSSIINVTQNGIAKLTWIMIS